MHQRSSLRWSKHAEDDVYILKMYEEELINDPSLSFTKFIKKYVKRGILCEKTHMQFDISHNGNGKVDYEKIRDIFKDELEIYQLHSNNAEHPNIEELGELEEDSKNNILNMIEKNS